MRKEYFKRVVAFLLIVLLASQVTDLTVFADLLSDIENETEGAAFTAEEEPEQEETQENKAESSVQLPEIHTDSLTDAAPKDVTGWLHPESAVLYTEEKQPIGDSIIDINTKIIVEFRFNFDLENNQEINADDYAVFNLPEIFDMKAAVMPVYEMSNPSPIAHVHISSDSHQVKVVFTEEIETARSGNFYFEFTAAFSSEIIGDGGEQRIEFELNGEMIVVDANFEKIQMSIEKELDRQYIEEGVLYQDWKLTINPYKKELNNLVVTDPLADGLVYKGYRFTDENGNDTAGAGWQFAGSTAGTVTFNHTGETSDTTYLILTTYASDFNKWTKKNGIYSIKNKVYLDGKDKSGSSLDQVTDEADTTFEMNFLSKDGTYAVTDGGIKWTVIANPEKQSLPQAKVTDLIPAELSMVESTITIYKEGAKNSPLSVGKAGTGNNYDVTYQSSSGSSGTTYVFSFGDISDCYYIEYLTEIAVDGFFEEDREADFSNEAFLSWEGRAEGLNTFETEHTASVVKVSNKWLNQFASNHWHLEERDSYSEWHMVLNESRQEVAGEVVLEDYLQIIERWPNNTLNYGRYYHEVLESSVKASVINTDGSTTAINSSSYKLELLDVGNKFNGIKDAGFRLTFNDGVISGKAVHVTFNSRISDETWNNLDVMVTNTSPTNYKNTALLTLNIGNAQTTFDSEKTVWASLRISEKYIDDYDYTNQTFSWRVHVNESKYKGLGETVLEDQLPEYNELVAVEVYKTAKNNGTFKANPVAMTSSGGSGSRKADKNNRIAEDSGIYSVSITKSSDYTKSGDAVEVTFAEDAIDGECYAVIIKSRIVDEYYTEIRSAKTFRNQSYIWTENAVDYQTNKHADKAVSASNISLTKSGTINREEGTFTWEAVINRNGNYDLRGAAVEDVLQDGLVLDVTSIRLYRYSLDSYIGSLTNETLMDIDLNDWLVYDTGSNQFTFTFPDTLSDAEASSAYKIVFDTIIEKDGTYSNNVSLSLNGEKLISSGSTTDQKVVLTELGAGAAVNRSAKITLNKTDEDDEPLAEAVFALKNADGLILEEGTSDVNGVIRFTTWLELETNYLLEEVTPPDGYRKATEPIKVYIEKDSAGKPVASTQTYIAVNEEMADASISVVKQDADDKYAGLRLAGAKFQLYRVSDMGQEVLCDAKTTGSNGIADFNGLKEGSYRLKEVEAPDGYEPSTEVFEFYVKPDAGYQNLFIYDADGHEITGASITVANTYSRTGTVEIRKVDKDNTGLYLEDAVFEMAYNASEPGFYMKVKTITIPESGKAAVTNLPLGYYQLTEVTAPRGYQITEPVEFKLTREDGVTQTKTVEVKNEKITVPITLVKADEKTGDLLSGAEFTVTPFAWEYYGSGHYDRNPVAGTTLSGFVSDAEGKIDLGSLPFGLYAIQEAKAPDGYQLNDEFLVVEITHPNTASDGEYRILYWDVTENEDGTHTYTQRTAAEYGNKINYIYNQEQLYNLTILKRDADTGKGLEGAGFEITDSEGNPLKNDNRTDGYYVTGGYGSVTVQLPKGSYSVTEKKAPKGYQIDDDTPKEVTVPRTAAGSSISMDSIVEVQVVFENTKITKDFTFTKTDGTAAIENNPAYFNLYHVAVNENNHITIPTLDDIEEVLETDEKGELKLTGLTEGFYVVQERTPPEGYVRTLDIYGIQLELNVYNSDYDIAYYKVPGGLSNITTTDLTKLKADFEAADFSVIKDIVNEKEIIYYYLTIYKQSDSGEPLAGAEFSISDSATGKSIEVNGQSGFKTDLNGQIRLELPAGAYIVTEEEAPEGYKGSGQILTVNLDANKAITVKNKPLTADVKFTKESESGAKLGGAEFGLYSLDVTKTGQNELILNHFDPQASYFTSSTEMADLGEINLANLTAGWYALQEVQAPEGYKRSLDIIVIYLYDDKGTLKLELYDVEGGLANIDNVTERELNNRVIKNEALDPNDGKFELVLYKTSEEQEALKGVVFGVYEDRECTRAVLDEDGKALKLITNELGMADYSFGDGTYYLHEEEGAAGYKMKGEVIEITGGASATVYQNVENETVTAEQEVVLQKLDEYGEKIKGAVFNLYKVDAEFQEDGSVKLHSGNPVNYLKNVESGDEGIIQLGKLSYGFYAVQEAVPADGYLRNLEDIIGIHVDENGAVSYYHVNRADYTDIQLIEIADEAVVAIINEQERYPVRIQKTADSGNMLAGAQFDLYLQGGLKVDSIVIGNSGEADFEVPAGEYYLKETKAPEGYYITEEEIEFTVEREKGSAHITYVTVKNEQIQTDVTVNKLDEAGNALAGAVFALYQIEVDIDEQGKFHYTSDSFIKQYRSGADGEINIKDLTAGWYALQETTAPDGYKRSLDVLAFYISFDQNHQPVITYYDVFSGRMNADVYYERELETGDAVLMQNQAETVATAELVIQKYNEFVQDDPYGMTDLVNLSGTKFKIMQVIEGTGTVQITEGAGSDGLYTTDMTGRIRLNLVPGTYLVEEVQAATGYMMETNPYIEEVEIKAEDIEAVIVKAISNKASGALEITKTDDQDNPQEGVVFSLYREDQAIEGSTVNKTRTFLKDYETDKDGRIEIDNLRYGTYYLEETAPLAGYIAADPITVTIGTGQEKAELEIKNESAVMDVTLQKIDKIARHGLPGAKFSLYTGTAGDWTLVNDTIQTDNSGEAVIKNLRVGSYRLEETKIPEGYTSDGDIYFEIRGEDKGLILYVDGLTDSDNKMLVENTPITGSVTVQKTGEKGERLSGARFGLYKTGETDYVAAGSTDASGRLTFDNLEYGISYLIKEIKAPRGYRLSEEAYEVQVKTQSENVVLDIVNESMKGSIVVTKRDKDTMELLAGAAFTLRDGNGDEVQTETTGITGTVIFDQIPCGSYTVEETQAPSGYVRDKTVYPADVTEDLEVVEITVTDEQIKGTVEIIKTDHIDSSIHLNGAVFELYRYNETTEDYSVKVGDTYTTKGDGRILMEGLEYGQYMLREIEAPVGYVIETAEHYFELTDFVNIRLEITNTRLGSVEITKVDARDSAILLNNVEFRMEKLEGEEYVNWAGEKTRYRTVNGAIAIDGLPEGSYRLWELSTVYGYKLLQEPVEFTITSAAGIQRPRRLTIKNEPVTADVLLRKIDSETGHGLQDAYFRLYKITDNGYYEAGNYVSRKDGVIAVEALTYGDYVLVEMRSPAGYAAADTETFISVTIETDEKSAVKITDKAGNECRADEEGYSLIGNEPDDTIVYGDGQVIVSKRDSTDLAHTLQGAVYTLEQQREDTWVPYVQNGVSSYTTNEYGFLMLDLESGEYRLKETEAPEGYKLDDDETYHYFTVYNDQQGLLYVDVENDPLMTGEITVRKIDSTDSEMLLAGAEFTLYEVRGDGTSRYVDAYTTDTDGCISIRELALRNYSLVETKAPEGYLMPEENKDIEISLTSGEYEVSLEIENDPIGARATLHKYDAHSLEAMTGITFDLHYRNTDQDEWRMYKRTAYATDEFGRIYFTGLKNGFYKVTETGTPDGYITAEPYYFEVAVDEELLADAKQDIFTADIYIQNERHIDAAIRKTDSKDISVLLSGAKFKLEKYEEGGYKEAEGAEIITDSSGAAVLESLSAGSYRLWEDKAPKGYQLLKKAISFDIIYSEETDELQLISDGAEAEDIHIKNVKIESSVTIVPEEEDPDPKGKKKKQDPPSKLNRYNLVNVVRTGDTNVLAGYILLLLMFGGVISYLVYKRRRN